jgi:hypothetical protein
VASCSCIFIKKELSRCVVFTFQGINTLNLKCSYCCPSFSILVDHVKKVVLKLKCRVSAFGYVNPYYVVASKDHTSIFEP